MPVEAVALVLGEHDDLQVAGVREVRQREVDDAIGAAKGNRRFRPVVGERQEAFAFAAGEHHHQDLRIDSHWR